MNGIKVYHDGEWGVPVHDDRKMFEIDEAIEQGAA